MPVLCLLAAGGAFAQLRQTFDLERGEQIEVKLGGRAATVELTGTSEDRDTVNGTIREARAHLNVNGQPVTIVYRYSHFASIDPVVTPGVRVRQGQKIGVLGKEGASGGWSHLHFEAVARQPSRKWGTEEGYAYLWQAWLAESKAEVIAVARPHRVAYAGETVTLDGSRSWSRGGRIANYEWLLTDGAQLTGARVQRRYHKPGYYTEVLRITDAAGRVGHDFAVVEIAHRVPELTPPTIHATFAPTTGIKAGQPVDFLVRTFRTTHGSEVWDFGDGTSTLTVQSDGCVKPLAKDGYARAVHRYAKPGRYLASVRRANQRGEEAVARLEVVVEE